MNMMLILLLVPVALLFWRAVSSKSRLPRRLGAAAAAMLTLVGAAVGENAPSENFLKTMRLSDVRDAFALLAAASGSLYLLWWSTRGGRATNRTLSIIAAVIGLVPIIAAIANAVIFGA
jgi:hypothetical protein